MVTTNKLISPEKKLEDIKKIKKIKKIRSKLSRKEKFLSNIENMLKTQKSEFLKRTQREPLTLLRQDKLSKIVGAGSVHEESKKITMAKKQARIKTLKRFSKVQENINKERLKISIKRLKLPPIEQKKIIPTKQKVVTSKSIKANKSIKKSKKKKISPIGLGFNLSLFKVDTMGF
jgi:hypothetical protein